MKNRLHAIGFLTLTLVIAGCASTASRDTAPAAPAATPRDAGAAGQIVGVPAPGSRFAKLKIGMDMSQTQELMGRTPERFHSYESGKRWIPFYFGNDARRMQVLYRGEGCLIFTGGNVWGGAGGDLVQIEVDPSGKCYQP